MIARVFILVLLFIVSPISLAKTYYLALTNDRVLPACSGSWSIYWTAPQDIYHCRNGKVTLGNKDTILSSYHAQLIADNGFQFSGKNTVGSLSYRIDIESNYGAIDWDKSNNHLYGQIYSQYGSIDMEDVTVESGVYTNGQITIKSGHIKGSVTSTGSGISIDDSSIGGAVDANGVINAKDSTISSYVIARQNTLSLDNTDVEDYIYAKGDVVVQGSEVTGNVTSQDNKVTVDDSIISGAIYGVADIDIEESEVSGDITSQYNKVTVKESIVTGAIYGVGDVVIEDSEVTGNIRSTQNEIKLNEGSRIVGDVTAGQPSWGTVYVNDGSTVDGACLYKTVPENACGMGTTLPDPVALYHMDETSWNGSSNEVVDSSGNGHHGISMNGASTASVNPALPSINSLGTCGYGIFDNNSNQFIEIPDNQELDIDSNLTLSAWVYPTSTPNSDLHTIVSKDNNYEVHINDEGRLHWWWEEQQGGGAARSLTSQDPLPLNSWSFITIRYGKKQGNKAEATMFVNSQQVGIFLGQKNRKLKKNNKPLQIGQDQNYPGRAFDGAIDEVQIFDEYLTNEQIEALFEQRHLCPDTPSLQCFTDDFNSGNLSNLWVTSSSKGTFTPDIVSNRLRFTEARGNQATASSYQRLFPAANNLVEIEFDHYAYGGNGADGIAIVLSDATVTPNPGAFGGPLGYGFKSGEPGFAGGWLGIGIDEYGNFSNEGGSGDKPGRRRQSVALRGSGTDETGYRYLAGACNNGSSNANGNCLDPTVDDNNSGDIHRYKIVIDSRSSGESNVEIFRKLGSGNWNTIVGPINVLDNQYSQSDIPEDFLLSITGSTGGSTNIHEIDNFQVCALDSRPIEDQIDHFRLTHSGQELTCNAESVLVEACLDETCSSKYTDSVTAHLAPATLDDGGWVGGNIVTFSGGSGSFDIRKNQIGSVILGVTGSSPTTRPFSKTLCSKAGSGFSTNNCELEFTSGGFDLVVSDKIANLPTTATLKAGGNCGPGFANESKKIAFWSTYESPNSSDIVGTPKVEIAGTEIGSTESTAAPINVQFNADGEAQLQLDYPDAGKLQLNVKYTGQVGEDDEGLVVEGDGQFVSFPQRLIVTAKNSAHQSGTCTNANLNCSTFAKAGERFDIEVTAVSGSDLGLNRSEIPTPNYSDSVGFEHLLVAPSGEELGELALYDSSDELITTPESVLLSLGETKLTPATISEVGVFSIKVTPPATYLGSSFHTIAAATSANIGRFYPAYFTIADSSTSPSLEAFCSDFNYIGQDFTYDQVPELYLEPKSVAGAITNNYYHANWWNYSTQWSNRSYIDSNSQAMLFEGDGGTTSEFVSGRVYLSDDELIRYEKSEPPIEPFEADFSFTLSASDLMDSDSVCVKTSDSNSLSDCLAYSFLNIDQDMELRWGRLLIHDTYGPEVSPIRQWIELQHFENGRFTTNALDSCTDFIAINRFDLASDDYTLVTSGTPNPPEVNASLLSPQTVDGEAWIEFSAPGAGETGFIDTEIDLNTHGTPWLIEDLDGAGTVSGIAQFGVYRGNDRVIWWSEQN